MLQPKTMAKARKKQKRKKPDASAGGNAVESAQREEPTQADEPSSHVTDVEPSPQATISEAASTSASEPASAGESTAESGPRSASETTTSKKTDRADRPSRRAQRETGRMAGEVPEQLNASRTGGLVFVGVVFGLMAMIIVLELLSQR